MARIVALSSLVARGHVGLRALIPALESFGHDVIALPTVVLSSHAAYPHVARSSMSTELLENMLQAIEANGWLRTADGIITGYLPSAAHVSFAEALIHRVRALNPAALFICDPVFGDDPKGLYVPEEIACQIKHRLLPLADLVTPNAFELAWLSERPVTGLQDAKAAAQALGRPMVLATSIPIADNRLGTLLHDASGTAFTSVPRRLNVPSGTGDLLTGLFTGALCTGLNPTTALAVAGTRLENILTASDAADDLNLNSLFQPHENLRLLIVEAAT